MTEIDYWRAEHDPGYYNDMPKATPCDYADDDGHYHCPYDDYPSDSERCRVCCGLGVDE